MIGKTNIWLLALLIFPLLMAILPVKSSCTLTIISRGALLVLLVVAGHGGCRQIFRIRDNILLSKPLWKIVGGLLGWAPTRTIYL